MWSRSNESYIPEESESLSINRAAQKLSEGDAIIFTSGAGLGVDSGLPDFRGPKGFWKAYPPMKHLGLEFSQMSNPTWFKKDPPFAWGFWSHRYHLYDRTEPHGGFDIMRRWANELFGDNYFVFTSNVDGHWQKKGFPEEKVNECHGSVHRMQCVDPNCVQPEIWPSSDFTIRECNEGFRMEGELPQCKYCEKLARPNVMMFGDFGFNPEREDAQFNRYTQFIDALPEDSKLVIVEIGAGKAVPTVRMTSEELANQFPNATLIRINPADGKVPITNDNRHISLRIGGLSALQQIDLALSQLTN